MTTAVDTNLLLDVLLPNPDFVEQSLGLLEAAAKDGPLVMSDLVYAELAAFFACKDELDGFLRESSIRRDSLSDGALFLAGRSWREYRSAGGQRDRIISDFLIGAHAQVQAGRLATRDRGFYRRYFRGLTIAEPGT
ncbi:MAG: type II toxin-antitoxin system VapC family toxin [Spirochaetaceae bacterium]|nr:type II toxin-antitoxin system VapC family toxin [Spirochaetaceae bacterium]